MPIDKSQVAVGNSIIVLASCSFSLQGHEYLAVFRGHLAFAKGISHPSALFNWHSGKCNAVDGSIQKLEVWHCQFNK